MTLTAIHMDQQVPQENQPVENQSPINPPAATEPVAPAASEATRSEPAPAAPVDKGIGKIDLSALASFSFGTQWTSAGERSEARGDRPERGDRGPRQDRRSFAGGPGGGDRGPASRDRRPAGRAYNPAAGPSGAAPAPGGAPRPERSFRGERSQGGGDFRRDQPAGYRGERVPAAGGERRFERGPRFERPAPQDLRPYLSPFFEVTFYAEDTAFTALVKAVRASCHTYELFEIARVVLAKTDRFVVVVQRKADSEGKRAPLFVTPVDGLPFENEDEAVQHVLRNHLATFFDISEVEVEAPKGNFQFVMRCGLTGELLGPPNYHRYQNILQQHHASRLSNMPFERFRERLETVKEPEIIAQWTEKMKKATRYVWKVNPQPDQPAPSFDSLEEARTYLLANARDKVVRSVDSARFHGKVAESLPAGEIRAAAEGHLERQRRFPLDTANSLRGRLRREGFTIFKRGSKGVSFVCAVKRKFRVPGQVFSESISALIQFIEKNPVVSVKELPAKHLGIVQPEAAVADTSAETVTAATAPAAAAPTEDEIKLKRLWMDLRWLVTEGYVTEYSDGKLFAAPPMSPQLQKSEEAANAAADAVEDAARAAAETAAPTAAPAEEVTAQPAAAVETPPVEPAAEPQTPEANPPPAA
jgi:hypothetical protein